MAADAQVKPATSYVQYVTWSLDPDTGQWEILGPAPLRVDTLVTTRHGVMGLNVDWPTRLNDAGHLLPWGPDQPAEDKAAVPLRRRQEKLEATGRAPAWPTKPVRVDDAWPTTASATRSSCTEPARTAMNSGHST